MIINKNDKKLDDIKNRGAAMEGDYLHTASEIISNVRENGDKALFEYFHFLLFHFCNLIREAQQRAK